VVGIVRMMARMRRAMGMRKSKTVVRLWLSLRPIVLIVPMYVVCGI
jgi:hypothetical protein